MSLAIKRPDGDDIPVLASALVSLALYIFVARKNEKISLIYLLPVVVTLGLWIGQKGLRYVPRDA